MTPKINPSALYDTFDYPKYWLGRAYEDRAEKMAIRRFLAQIPKEHQHSLIDIGGGFGRLAEVYAPIFSKCLLVDPSGRLLAQAQKRLKDFPHIQIQKGSVEALPCQENEFDVALLVRLIHHLKDPYLAFLEAHRVLKPGGFLILEFANKIHFRACLRAWLKKDFDYSKSFIPVSQSTQETSEEKEVLFLNHHPKFIQKELKRAGFKVISCLSVSNLRYPWLKRILPLRALLFFEAICQRLLVFCHFGPSIFLLCQKSNR